MSTLDLHGKVFSLDVIMLGPLCQVGQAFLIIEAFGDIKQIAVKATLALVDTEFVPPFAVDLVDALKAIADRPDANSDLKEEAFRIIAFIIMQEHGSKLWVKQLGIFHFPTGTSSAINCKFVVLASSWM